MNLVENCDRYLLKSYFWRTANTFMIVENVPDNKYGEDWFVSYHPLFSYGVSYSQHLPQTGQDQDCRPSKPTLASCAPTSAANAQAIAVNLPRRDGSSPPAGSPSLQRRRSGKNLPFNPGYPWLQARGGPRVLTSDGHLLHIHVVHWKNRSSWCQPKGSWFLFRRVAMWKESSIMTAFWTFVETISGA